MRADLIQKAEKYADTHLNELAEIHLKWVYSH